MSNKSDERDDLEVVELDSEQMEGVTGGWEFEQLKGGKRRRWDALQEQAKSEDEDEREYAEQMLAKQDKKYSKKYDGEK